MSLPSHPQIGETRNYGFKWQEEDKRDYKFGFESVGLPISVDLSDTVRNPVLDQGSVGSCTANATAVALKHTLLTEKYPWIFLPSRLYIYNVTRTLEGTALNVDSGASIRDVFLAVSQYRVCTEQHMPYIPEKFSEPIPVDALSNAKLHANNFKYLAVAQNLTDLKTCLFQGYFIVFGTMVYSSFESQNALTTGNIPIPNISTETYLGNHALAIVGYNDNTQMFKVQNSWGSNVGDKGYFYFPYSYITNQNLCSDFWTVRNFS